MNDVFQSFSRKDFVQLAFKKPKVYSKQVSRVVENRKKPKCAAFLNSIETKKLTVRKK